VAYACSGSSTGDEGARVPDAERRLAAYLQAALTSDSTSDPDDFMACVPDGTTDRTLVPARYRVVASSRVRDTVYASAEITSVAEERRDPEVYYGYIAELRVRTDTLRWQMIRDGTGGWGVCGYSLEGYGLGRYGSDSLTRWLPREGSLHRMNELIDSVQRAVTEAPGPV
jgi:hypothetical protein